MSRTFPVVSRKITGRRATLAFEKQVDKTGGFAPFKG